MPTSGQRHRPVYFLRSLPLFFTPFGGLSAPESGCVYCLWDSNSTAVCCACQQLITIYCIPLNYLGEFQVSAAFSTNPYYTARLETLECGREAGPGTADRQGGWASKDT